jgi:hypothetical protein
MSMLAVASSKMIILFFLKIALIIQRRDFSPVDKLAPPSVILRLSKFPKSTFF